MLDSLKFTVCFFLGFSLHAAVPADWTTPVKPFAMAGNIYYVGSKDLASYLVTTPEGNVLINANLESSPAQIRASVEQLGFRWGDTKLLLSSQAHYDHAAGAAQIVRETGAKYLVMDGDVDVIESGGATEFDQTLARFPVAHVDHVLHDGEVVKLGGTSITAHKTAGHTKGCTTWTMQALEGGRKLDVVIVGGWGPNPGVRLVARKGLAASYPGIAADYEKSFAELKRLPCDVFLGAHGVYYGLLEKMARMAKEGKSVWVDGAGYRRAVAEHEADYRKVLAKQ